MKMMMERKVDAPEFFACLLELKYWVVIVIDVNGEEGGI